ncbi:MAG: hypothetical protein ACRCUY_04660 [Thermoguttaceae bacterium]
MDSTWNVESNAKLSIKDKTLFVEAVNGPPTIFREINSLDGRVRITMKIRTQSDSDLSIFWMTKNSPRRSPDKLITTSLIPDGKWHEYSFPIPAFDAITGISARFSDPIGTYEIDSIDIYRTRPHPLVVQKATIEESQEEDGEGRKRVRVEIQNTSQEPFSFQINKQSDSVSLAGNESVELLVPVQHSGNLAASSFSISSENTPDVNYSIFNYFPDETSDWISCPLLAPFDENIGNVLSDQLVLEIAHDARMARIRNENEVIAIIAPIVHRDGIIPTFVRQNDSTTKQFNFQSDTVSLQIKISGQSIHFSIQDKTQNINAKNDKNTNQNQNQNMDENANKKNTTLASEIIETENLLEGPVIRLFGTMQSGLLSGVEFLGPGDTSSSIIDLAPPHNERSRPDRQWITMPLAVIGTEKGNIMMTWKDMTLQPTFSSPNRFDFADDHRMSLCGSSIETTIDVFLLSQNNRTETAALAALQYFVSENEFPEPPPPPRDSESQKKLSLSALQGPLQGEDGMSWGYAVQSDWPRKPFADDLSTLARLISIAPKPMTIVSGGSDISNDAIYFLSNRVLEWKEERSKSVQSLLSVFNPDGSFTQRTRFTQFESASTSFGYTAVRALEIMEYVRFTGDRGLFEEVKKSLQFLSNCEIPSGGFYRNTPYHTPDLLTAAHIVWLSVWAFEFSGDESYLDLAKRFAHLGLPFVYQWTDSKIMLYVTVPKLGGTERQLPRWFGISQTRVGLIYAYSLNLLAKHDKTLSWKRVATGILHSIESMQYSTGPDAGCIPDIFVLQTQEHASWQINPCALVSLRMAIEGKVDSLFVLQDGDDRYTSPFPIRIKSGKLEAVEVPSNQPFQILKNGNRVTTRTGPGPILSQ